MAKSTNPLTALRQGLTRDKQIVLCYKAGNTINEIAAAFQITKQRIQQILIKEGCTRDDNPKTRNRGLYAFIGANVPKDVKAAVEKEAKKRGLSISALVSRVLQDELSMNMGEEE